MGVGMGGGGGGGVRLILFLTTGKQNFLALPTLYSAGVKGMNMGKFIPDRKNKTIMIFDKPIKKI